MENNKKYKILALSDHALTTSGVATQTRHLIEGLLKKNCYKFIQMGAAVKHSDYRTIMVNEDFIIKPIDGFGDKNLIRALLIKEKPDALFIFTDPRFFTWLFDMEDEVHQVCPILYWHVWDNYPVPKFNYPYYEAVDKINCLSRLTYDICSEDFSDKTEYIPHAIPNRLFYPLEKEKVKEFKMKLLGKEKEDWFVCFWANRNCKRKRPGDVLFSWKYFLDKLEKEKGHRKAVLVMHTEPTDMEGSNLFEIANLLKIKDNILYSRNKVDFEQMNVLHNISDCYLNISFAEGFGLGSLEAMQCGKPIIVPKTGGQTRQIIDWRDGSQNGIALEIDTKSISGNQAIHYIFEDFVNVEQIGEALYQMYEMCPDNREKLGQKAKEYARFEFDYDQMIEKWHQSFMETIQDWKSKRRSFNITNMLGEEIYE